MGKAQGVPDTMTALILQIMLCLLGFSVHIAKSMKQVSSNGNQSVLTYLKTYPLQTWIAFGGAVVGMFGFYEMGQLNYTTAFACGYMANSLADSFGGRVIKQLR